MRQRYWAPTSPEGWCTSTPGESCTGTSSRAISCCLGRIHYHWRCPGEAGGFRHRPDSGRDQVDRDRHDSRDGRVFLSGAGAGRGNHPGQRRVFPRPRPARVPHRRKGLSRIRGGIHGGEDQRRASDTSRPRSPVGRAPRTDDEPRPLGQAVRPPHRGGPDRRGRGHRGRKRADPGLPGDGCQRETGALSCIQAATGLRRATTTAPARGRRRTRILALSLAGALAASLAVLGVVFAPQPTAAPVAPSYPAVEGQLGGHLQQLQRSVEP